MLDPLPFCLVWEQNLSALSIIYEGILTSTPKASSQSLHAGKYESLIGTLGEDQGARKLQTCPRGHLRANTA